MSLFLILCLVIWMLVCVYVIKIFTLKQALIINFIAVFSAYAVRMGGIGVAAVFALAALIVNIYVNNKRKG
jgi:hypothetical protein